MIDPYYAQASMELQNLQSGLISTKRVTHRVRRGESLSVIANRYRVSVRDLQRWNNISDPRKLRAGTTITVYQSPEQLPAPTSGSVRHVVQRGDSLWKIARKYNVKVDDIRNWNGMNGETVLRPGQAIRIEL
jgi:membrane-bound lytic murein transglycosylase D